LFVFLERASISLLMFSAKQGNNWYQFNVVGMTRSLTALGASPLPLGYQGGGIVWSEENNICITIDIC